MSTEAAAASASRWQRFAAASVRVFHAYAGWLVGISWWRFALLSILLLIISGILQHIPPFSWKVSQTVTVDEKERPAKPKSATVRISKDKPSDKSSESYEITIDKSGVRITPKTPPASASVSASSAAPEPPSVPEPPAPPTLPAAPSVDIRLPPGATSETVREAVEEARRAIIEAIEDAKQEAEAEQLKRQVVEARMAAMQAQVEPHFLFNTLASIDHLIETDPARASTMQKNLIALLRASMPTLRDGDGGPRDLKRELEVIRPYLEILKVRMEDRLHTEIDVPDGLLSAEFPSMMIQTLVENAIKHGLEPKPEGGRLRVSAEVQHGKLAVTVADSGVGFGKAATAGTGVGLANVRERLRLLYGDKAALNVRENAGGGTAVTITVPYKSIDAGAAV